MDLDQSVLEKLSAQQRHKINRQQRQKQVQNYLQFIKNEESIPKKKKRKPNKKKTAVNFGADLILQDAVENFDDREVSKLLKKGGNSNYATGNNTTLLHKCAGEDNVSIAEILIKYGAKVNAADDDWWTPLHVAASCDSSEVVQLLLNNGADVSLLDVDGFFAVDHATEGSESQQILNQHMESKGFDEKKRLHVQVNRARKMYKEILNHIDNGGSPNKITDNNVTWLHIASANGYKKVMKILLKNGADFNSLDDYGWSPLHVAARFNQLSAVQLLLRRKADANTKDRQGCKPSAVTGSDEIRRLLMKAEKKAPFTDTELKHQSDDDEVDGEEDVIMEGVLLRINSKTVRPKRVSLSKEDELSEARKLSEQQNVYDEIEKPSVYMDMQLETVKESEDKTEDEDVYVTKLWRAEVDKGVLPAVMDTDNLKDSADISEETILKQIEKRFNNQQIYTFIGQVLLAVNPFKDLPLYAKSVSFKYHIEDRTSLPPHVYAVAEEAYCKMLTDQTSQCCVISGESGAGKTETCKFLVQHLTRVAASDENNLNNKISQVNPVLEAFGNAKTMINENSSRFAKFISICFNKEGKITGAYLTEYLLEKSRVVNQERGELNFHIFYWMFSGLSPEERSLYKLKSLTSHRYLLLRDIEPSSLISTESKEKFWELKDCLKFIGFTTDDIQGLLLTLSAVLHIGDITFRTGGSNDMAVIANVNKVKEVSELLNISSEELSSALTAEYTVARGEQIKKERTVHQANDCRNALAKAIYSRLFSWIVNGINQLIQPEDNSNENFRVGILDIFGFENFARNSFEQMCINLANEQMQNYTNEHIFCMEQQDCLLEGVQLVDLNYRNNQPIIDAFMEKHTGILAIMDEESRFPKATDQSLTTKLHQGPGKNHPQVYKTPKGGSTVFTILHFAGSVTYDLQGVLEKNRDTLPNSILHTVKTSNNLLIKELFQSKITRTGSLAPSARQQRSRRRTTTKSPFEFFKKLKGGKGDDKNKTKRPVISVERKGPATMAFHFKNSLGELMSKVQSATPHIIRCIKPNTTKSAMLFTSEYVLAQLRYTGIEETIKIKKFGYPHRIKFYGFLSRYNVITVCYIPSHCMSSAKEKCRMILDSCKLSPDKDDLKIGKTKVFLKDSHVDILNKRNEVLIKQIVTAESAIRRYLALKNYNKMKVQHQYQKEMDIATFCHQVSLKQEQVLSWLMKQTVHDSDRYLNDQKKEEVMEICKSLDLLDTLIDDYAYEDCFSKKPEYEEYEDCLNKKPDPDKTDIIQDTGNVTPGEATPIENPDMNNHVQYRGLPTPPFEELTFTDTSMPPPCPRQLYGQSGIYDVIPGQQEYLDNRSSKAPPIPKRNPDTRLSRTSSASSDTYEDTSLINEYNRHSQQSPGQSPRQPAMSPVHSPRQPPMSPRMQVKHAGQPLSTSSNINKPFSYITNLPGSPKQKRRSEGPQYNQPVEVPNDPTYEDIGHAVHYTNGTGRNSMIPGQGQISPGDFQGHVPMSPKTLRKSLGSKMSPVLTRKHSDRRSNSPIDSLSHSHGHGHMPPSFPAPPPPLPVTARFVAAIVEPSRSPSPPLPPPPPELQGQVIHRPASPVVQQHIHDQPPPPPPISKIPGRSSVSSFELRKKSQPEIVPVATSRLNNNIDNYVKPESVTVPNRQQISSLADEINKVKLKPGASKDVVNTSSVDNYNLRNGNEHGQTLAAEIGKVRLAPVTTSKVSPEKTEPDSQQILKPKLRPTGPKPWEKDQQPPQHSTNTVDIDDLPPPPPPVDTELPPPPVPDEAISRPVEIIPQANGISKQKKDKSPGGNQSLSGMDINLDEIDVSQIPGYTVITAAVPNWKRDMVEKKNKEKLDEYIRQLQKKKAEAEKWKNVPEWKRKLMEEKEKAKEEQEHAKTEALKQQQAKAQLEAEERKRQEKILQKEREEEMRKELEDVPEWKREIMLKRGGELKNWGDEREEENKDE